MLVILFLSEDNKCIIKRKRMLSKAKANNAKNIIHLKNIEFKATQQLLSNQKSVFNMIDSEMPADF